MKKQTFQEYISSKSANGKIKKPVIDASGDQLDVRNPPDKLPNKTGRYKPGVCEPKTAGHDWGRLGEKDLIYKPKTFTGTGAKPAKIPTVEQVQMVNAIVKNMRFDPSLIEAFVRSIKNAGMLGALIAEVFGNREATSHLAEILASESYGPRLLKGITKSLNEEVAKPFSDELDGTSEEGDDEDDEDDPFADEDDEDGEIGNGDEEGQDDNMQVGEEPDPNQDPSMMGMDPSMGGDPSMMGMDPSMGGMDPSMGAPPGGGMNPSMMMGQQAPQMMQQPQMPQQPPMNPMQQFQRAMMRAHQRAMMRKG